MQAMNFVKRMRRSIQEGTTNNWVSVVSIVIKILIFTRTELCYLCLVPNCLTIKSKLFTFSSKQLSISLNVHFATTYIKHSHTDMRMYLQFGQLYGKECIDYSLGLNNIFTCVTGNPTIHRTRQQGKEEIMRTP